MAKIDETRRVSASISPDLWVPFDPMTGDKCALPNVAPLPAAGQPMVLESDRNGRLTLSIPVLASFETEGFRLHKPSGEK